jgi:glycosyltransferase involved in cell wall biosynthesis
MERSPRVWVDTTTLFRWQGKWAGIPRTMACVLHEWLEQGLEPGLCRVGFGRGLFRPVSVPDLLALYERQARAVSPPPLWARGLRLARGLARRCPLLVRAFQALVPPPAPDFAPGDVLFSPGGSWEDPGYAEAVGRLKRSAGLRFVPVVYDLIPHRFPHFFPRAFAPRFRDWLGSLLPVADRIVTISESSRRDLAQFAEASRAPLPSVEVVRLGDRLPARAPERPPACPRARGLTAEPFVLIVGTVEVRKNHALAYQVWRRLLEERGPAVPPLVIAGERGWLCDDLHDLIDGDPVVQGKVLLLHGLDDGELTWLYRNCLFTLYPSHYEGWGLPVCEALAHGKHCITTDRSSLPEIAGGLVDYHDPLDFRACKDLVERALFDEDYRRRREERARRDYRRTSWAECAAAVWSALAAGGRGRERAA